jgi:hypothetical protein
VILPLAVCPFAYETNIHCFDILFDLIHKTMQFLVIGGGLQ